MQNQIIVITGRVGRSYLSESIAALFEECDVMRLPKDQITKRNLKVIAIDQKKLILIDEGDQEFIDKLVRTTFAYPVKFNIVINCQEKITDHFATERVRVIEL